MPYPVTHVMFFVLCISAVGAYAILGSSTSPIVYVNTDGSGDYNCDGINDEVEINRALSFVANNDDFTTVHLNGSNTYWISNPVLIGNNTILEGDSDAKIKLINNAGWDRWIGLIEPSSFSGADRVGGVGHNITIQGFEIDGNSANNSHPVDGYYIAMLMDNCINLTVRNMYIHHTSFDGIRVILPTFTEGVGNINVHNNIFYLTIHDSIGMEKVDIVNVYNNTITPRTNAGIRILSSNHVKIHNNTIDPLRITAGAAIQIQSGISDVVMDDIEIYNNVINRANLAAIWMLGYQTSAVADTGPIHIHHNTITNSGMCVNLQETGAGILIQGFSALIENNVLDRNYQDGIAINEWEPCVVNGNGYIITVRNNIITNTIPSPDLPSTTGYGLNNHLTATHTMTSDYNNIYNNALGNYKNTDSTTDIHVDPLFADPSNHDYHLKSIAGRWSDSEWVFDTVSSPLIDAGHSTSDHSNEPESNGNRINIGRYGNTAEASRSVSDQPTASNRTVTAGEIVTLEGSASTDNVCIVCIESSWF